MICKFIRGFPHDEDGASTILAIFWFILFVGLGGLAVDVTNGFRVQTMMQATADSAAHAAVIDLPDPIDGTTTDDNKAAALATALAYAQTNMPPALHGTVLTADDVEIGAWNPWGRTFTPGGTPSNAVRVTLRSTRATGNSVPTNFLRIIGLQEWNISVTATAAYSVPGDCFNNGFISRGKVYSGSRNDYVDDICIHGERGVKVGSTNDFERGVTVSMPDLALLEESQENAGLHPEKPQGALLETSRDPQLVDQVPSIVAGLMDGSVAPPNYMTNVVPAYGAPPLATLPSTLVPNTLYRIDGVVDFGSGSNVHLDIHDIGIVSNSEIKSGSLVKFSNVVMATLQRVSLGSENLIGASDFCNTGDGAVFIFAGQEYSAGSQSGYSGTQIVGMQQVKLGSELISLKGIDVQAGEDLFWGSAEEYGGCHAPSFFALDGRVAIVD